MKELLKKIAIVSGICAVLIPLIMVFLWKQYIEEQSNLNSQVERQLCEPYEFSSQRIAEKRTLSWKTSGDCSGFILLATTYSDFSNLPYKVLSTQGDAPSKSHEFTITKQDEGKYRYVVVVSEGEWYGIQGAPIVLGQE